MDVVNFKVRERMRNGQPPSHRDFFENFMSDKTGKVELPYSEILRESNIFIAAGNVRGTFSKELQRHKLMVRTGHLRNSHDKRYLPPHQQSSGHEETSAGS